MSDKYNGWTNYETWNIGVWMDWDYYIDEPNDSDSIQETSERIRYDYNEGSPDMSGVYSDLLQHALDKVNWYEIAEHIHADITGDE